MSLRRVQINWTCDMCGPKCTQIYEENLVPSLTCNCGAPLHTSPKWFRDTLSLVPKVNSQRMLLNYTQKKTIDKARARAAAIKLPYSEEDACYADLDREALLKIVDYLLNEAAL